MRAVQITPPSAAQVFWMRLQKLGGAVTLSGRRADEQDEAFNRRITANRLGFATLGSRNFRPMHQEPVRFGLVGFGAGASITPMRLP